MKNIFFKRELFYVYIARAITLICGATLTILEVCIFYGWYVFGMSPPQVLLHLIVLACIFGLMARVCAYEEYIRFASKLRKSKRLVSYRGDFE
jgi:hypothetical protein